MTKQSVEAVEIGLRLEGPISLGLLFLRLAGPSAWVIFYFVESIEIVTVDFL